MESSNYTFKMECHGCLKLFSEMGLRAHMRFCKKEPIISQFKKKNGSDLVKLGHLNRHELIENLPDCRQDDVHGDVTVVTAERDVISCHCVVLAAASPVWRELLDRPSREDENVLVVTENMSSFLWRSFLDLLYTGSVLVGKGDLEDFQNVLEVFGIKFSVELDNGVKDEVDVFEDVTVEPFEEDGIEFDNNEFEIGLEERNGFRGKSNGSIRKFTNGAAETIPCDYCEAFKSSLVKMKWHIKKSHKEKMEDFLKTHEKYPCDLCSKKFLNKKLVFSHKKQVHSSKRSKRPRVLYPEDGFPWRADRQCPHCPKVLNSIAKFDDHLKTHSEGDFPYSCDYCKFKCQRAVSFRRHVKRHQRLENPLLCIDCGESFFTEFELRKHGWKHPKRKAKKVEVEPVQVAEELLCNLCGKSFTKRVALAEHLKYAHVKEEDKFHCTECDFKTAMAQNFKRHSLLHKPPTLQCNHCEKKFHTEVYRRNHVKIVHTADHLKDFVCSQCGKGFTNADVFKGHMNMHQGLKPYKCRYCDKCYQNHSNCMAHEKKIHPDMYVKRRNDHLGGIPISKR